MSEPRSEAPGNEHDEAVADGAEEVVATDDAATEGAATEGAATEGAVTGGAVTEEDGTAETAEEAPDHTVPLEAILFSSEVPLSAKRLALWLHVGQRDVLAAIDRLNVFYGETGRAFRISPLAGGFQLVTTADHAALLGKLHKERVPTRLSRAALETLSIIAFKQPVTRGEVDAIRGVSASDRVLRHLIDRKLVRISGRAEAPGRPLLYGTTREFLGYFGLSAVSDLPRTDELEALLAGDLPQDAMDAEETTDLFDDGAETRADAGEVAGEEDEVAMMDDRPAGAERDDSDDPDDEPSGEFDDDPADDLAEELAEDSAAEQRKSHSGEESDDHEGIPSPQ